MDNVQAKANAGKNIRNLLLARKQSNFESIYNALSRLLEEKVFDCDRCDKLLTPPVRFVANVGNVCKTCVEEWRDVGNRLEKYDAILRSIAIVRCTTEECRAPVLDGDLECHLRQHCKYRQVECVAENCPWKNRLVDLVGHFEKEHRADVMDNVQFDFVVGVHADVFVIAKLLIREDHRLLVVLERKQGSEVISYKIVYARIEQNNPGNDLVGLLVRNVKDFRIDVRIARLNTIDDRAAGLNIEVERLKTILAQSRSNRMRIILLENKTLRPLKLLKCPGCSRRIRLPLYKCDEGHNICTRCSPQLLACTWCTYESAMNLNETIAVEAATSAKIYQCVNQSRGCTIGMLGKRNIADHESKCPYTMYNCPAYIFDRECDYKGNFSDLKQHVTQIHTNVHENKGCWFNFNSSKTYVRKFYLFRNCNIFEVHFHHSGHRDKVHSFCAVRKLLPENGSSNVCCNVSICHLKTSREMRIRLLIANDTTPATATFHHDIFQDGQYFNGEIDLTYSAVFDNEMRPILMGRQVTASQCRFKR